LCLFWTLIDESDIIPTVLLDAASILTMKFPIYYTNFISGYDGVELEKRANLHFKTLVLEDRLFGWSCRVCFKSDTRVSSQL
jgi:hypothetical protein